MEGRPKRRLVVTVRGAGNVPDCSSPYVMLQLGDEIVETDKASVGGVNPVGGWRWGAEWVMVGLL